jgi:hypothetical protein
LIKCAFIGEKDFNIHWKFRPTLYFHFRLTNMSIYFKNILYEEKLLLVSQCVLHGRIIKRKFCLHEIFILGFIFFLADKRLYHKMERTKCPYLITVNSVLLVMEKDGIKYIKFFVLILSKKLGMNISLAFQTLLRKLKSKCLPQTNNSTL